jgi:hypothetical protein
MAENKKSFILYADLLTVVKMLVEKDRINKTNYGGELFLIILEYVNDLNPIPIDFIVEMAFEPIKLQLKRDLVKRVHWNYKGGITTVNRRIRNSTKIKYWRKYVLKRDNYTCQNCFKKDGRLHVHHIKSFANFPELRTEISNGVTLCKPCHIIVHSKPIDYGKTRKK